MFGVMLQKIWHKKWMVLCLLLGCVLLMATVVSFPMYKEAVFDRMLPDEFGQHMRDNSEWPAMLEMKMISKKDKGGKAINRMETLMDEIHDKMGVTEYETVKSYTLGKVQVSSLMKRKEVWDLSLKLGTLFELPEHVEMISGEMYSEDGLDEEGNYEVVISQSCMVASNLLLGEVLEFDGLKDSEGNPIRIKIAGIYKQARTDDFFWQITPEQMNDVCLMKEELFLSNFTGENAGKYTITCMYYPMFRYKDLKASSVEQIQNYTNYLVKESAFKGTTSRPDYMDILDGFTKKRSRIESTLLILQIPVLILLCAFLFMISAQMYDMERNEISIIKSRGSSKGQIVRLYLYQSIFLTALGVCFGFPLGGLFCKILGSARNFLEFNLSSTLTTGYSKEVLLFGLSAALVCIIIMTVPALKHSDVSIVKLKQLKAVKKKSLWEKCFLDVICLAIGLYGYYNFSKNENALVANVLQGEALDPLLYISSSLFIVGMGLLFLRLQALLIKLIYFLGMKFWHPASYASFMETIRNGRKQQFIMLFMILIISLGMYHAIVARTILQNALNNTEYLVGTDVILQEKWNDNSSQRTSQGFVFRYTEPDFGKYGMLDTAQSYTKVVYDENAYINLSSKNQLNVILMGIHTKEFGENTKMDDELLEKPYYEYLNKLAVVADGILVSSNFRTLQDYKIGDSLTYYDETFYGGQKNQATGKIVDFIEYWPGYEPTTTILNQDGSVTVRDNYLIVAHITTLNQKWGVLPYEIWINIKDDADTQELYEWIQEEELHLTKYISKTEQVEKTIEDPLLQGTNGVLTMGFIVTIILCAVGYLIYWIMSIRSREMIFGVLRACGMHKGEVFHMLMNEQIFSGGLSIIAGIGIGKLTSDMFVPMIQAAYAAANQVIPMQLITNQSDMFRLYGVIIGVMAVCLCVLVALVLKLNVVKALKLGEE
jgi:putative ABC transport system permease protein